MREILFRGKRVDNGEWVKGGLLYGGDRSWIVETIIFPTKSGNQNVIKNQITYEIDPETVGQYLVVKDKNGKKCFEGDRFTTEDYPFESDGLKNYEGVFEFMEDSDYAGWYYDIRAISDRVRGSACGGSICDLNFETLEIIGNIHDKDGK